MTARFEKVSLNSLYYLADRVSHQAMQSARGKATGSERKVTDEAHKRVMANPNRISHSRVEQN